MKLGPESTWSAKDLRKRKIAAAERGQSGLQPRRAGHMGWGWGEPGGSRSHRLGACRLRGCSLGLT